MKFLFDHDVPEDLSYLLEQLGHNVALLRKVLPEDASDEAVLQFAHENGYLLLTCNRNDFLELAKEQPHHGIVVIHPPSNASGGTGGTVWTLGARW